MSLRIAFCGASGTGKTTLACFLSEKEHLPLNPVGSRSVAAAMGFSSPYEADHGGRRAEFQAKLFADKIAWENEHDDFVTDRTVFDNLVYQALHSSESLDDERLSQTIYAMRRYTHVFLCPMSAVFNLGDDPMRKQGVAYHRIFEAAVRGLLEMCRIDYEEITHTKAEDRQMFLGVRVYQARLP